MGTLIGMTAAVAALSAILFGIVHIKQKKKAAQLYQLQIVRSDPFLFYNVHPWDQCLYADIILYDVSIAAQSMWLACQKPIVHKYRKGNMQSTLKRYLTSNWNFWNAPSGV